MNTIQENALNTCHGIWMATLTLACIIGVLSGASLVSVFLVGLIGLAPGFVYFLTRASLFNRRTPGFSTKFQKFDAENVLVITWLLSTLMISVWMGAAQSAAGLVLVIAPLIGLLLDRPKLVRESAGFAILICLGSLILSWLGIEIGPGQADSALLVPLTVLAIGFAIFLVLQLAQMSLAERTRAEAEHDSMKARLETERNQILIHNAPWLMAAVSPDGKIGQVLGGDKLWWPQLAPGRTLQSAFPDLASALRDGRPATTPLGDRVSIRKARLDDGSYSLLITLPDAPSPVHDVEPQNNTLGRNDWIAGLGHDLKTPLNAIIGFSEIMKENTFGPLPERYAKYPERIFKSGAQLRALIDDIMDVSKAEADRHILDLEPIDLIAVGEEVADQLEPLKEQAELNFRIVSKTPVIAEADYRAVFRIWQNLVSNAIKYSKAGGRVTLAAGTRDGMAVLRVIDEGVGMNEDDLNRIAEPFAMGKNAKGKAGTGLGLAVVRTFAELHGGKMVINTAPDAGTRIDVYLPLYNEMEKAAE